jgi:hypothetical protein
MKFKWEKYDSELQYDVENDEGKIDEEDDNDRVYKKYKRTSKMKKTKKVEVRVNKIRFLKT